MFSSSSILGYQIEILLRNKNQFIETIFQLSYRHTIVSESPAAPTKQLPRIRLARIQLVKNLIGHRRHQ